MRTTSRTRRTGTRRIVCLVASALLAACSSPCLPLLSADVLPKAEQGRLDAAEHSLEAGDANLALAEFRALIEDHPNHFRAMRGEQEALVRLGRVDEARAIAQRRSVERDDAAAALLLARLSDEPKEEAAAIARALDREPDHPYAQLALAMASLRRGDLVAASPHLDRSLEVCAPPPESRLARARVRAATGDFEGAESDYREYLLTRPRDLAARHELASLLHRELARRDDALSEYRSMLALDAGSIEAKVGIAVIATARGDFAEAERLYTSIVEVEPVALLNLGLLYRDELARKSEALDCFRRYLEFSGERAGTRAVTDRLFVVPGYVADLERELSRDSGGERVP